MQGLGKSWAIGGSAIIATLTSAILNVVFAYNLNRQPVFATLRALLFVAFALQILAVPALVYFTCVYTKNLRAQPLEEKKALWLIYGVGVAISGAALTVSGVTLVWLAIDQHNTPVEILQQSLSGLLGAWFTVWAISLVLVIALFVTLGISTKQILKTQSVGRLDLDFGVHLPPMEELPPGSRPSFSSRDTTLASPPRTPTSTRAGSTLRYSTSTRIGPGSSRIKLVQGSAKTSLDVPNFSAGEASILDSAFDRWDTSNIHHEMRAVIASSPPVTRSGLETIPGSRPESPANALEGPFLPSSPIAITSDTATALDWQPSSSPRPANSSPPSSPPNFSRPTSKKETKAFPTPLESTVSMHEIIHPLFRPDSPHPPPVATAGTMVTASPLANQPITPKTLARLRSTSDLRRTGAASTNGTSTTGHWRAMPSIDSYTYYYNNPRSRSQSLTQSSTQPVPEVPAFHLHPDDDKDQQNRASLAGSITSVTTTQTTRTEIGSPGPSIMDDSEGHLPPILPGFVLSAGQRTSLLGYGKRKSVKQRKSKGSIV